MAPGHKRIGKIKNRTLHYALEKCDRAQLVSVISKTGVDGKAVFEVMHVIKKSQDIYKNSLTPLQGAISIGHYNIVKHLLEEGAILESSTAVPHPLCLALQKGHHEIAKLLIESGANIKISFDGKLPLGYALEIENCPVDIVKHIIDAGFPINDMVHIYTGKTALHAAVNLNHTDLVKYFLSLEINLNLIDRRGLTPLHYAVQKNNVPHVKLLVKAGATIDCECYENFTPMFYAIATGNYEMVKLLLTLGADINHVNANTKCPMAPLHFAANFCKLKITQLLLEKGADVNQVVPLTGEIALHSAARADVQNCQQNKVSLDCIVELLINERSTLEAKNNFGWTPLHLAIKYKNISSAKILIANGANLNSIVNESDEKFYSAFHLVAKTFDIDLIKLSLDYGADYMLKDSEGMYPCHLALIYSFIDNFAHSSADPQSSQGRTNQCEQVEQLVFKLFWRAGFPFDMTLDIKWIKPNIPGYPNKVAAMVQKQKMLLNGIKAQNIKMVQKAFSQGADVQFYSKEQRNAIHLVASKGNEQILKEFLTRGACVNSLNRYGETPLHLAAKGGHVNCCRLLLEHGAVYNYVQRKSKKTPSDLAHQNNHGEVVALLSSIDKFFKEIKKGNLKKLKQDMKIFPCVMNCCHRDGNTLLGRATHLNLKEAASKLLKLRSLMVKFD